MIIPHWAARRPLARGLVCLVRDESTGRFDCYWYRGRQEDHLVDQASCGDQSSALLWGRARSGRVRVRDHGETAWAGTDSVSDGQPLSWSSSSQMAVGPEPDPRRRRDYRR